MIDLRTSAIYSFFGFQIAIRPMKIAAYVESYPVGAVAESAGLLLLLGLVVAYCRLKTTVLARALAGLMLVYIIVSIPYLIQNLYRGERIELAFACWTAATVFFLVGTLQLMIKPNP